VGILELRTEIEKKVKLEEKNILTETEGNRGEGKYININKTVRHIFPP
jgi:hypothetical protein